MKKITIFGLLILFPFISLVAQEEDEFKTLLGNVESYGVYGAFSVGYSNIDSKDAVVAGGQVALVLDHSVSVGFGGKGFFNEYHYDANLDDNVNLQGGYGGLFIEPVLGSKEAIHFSFPVLIGAGGIVHADKIYHYDRYDYRYDDYFNDSEVFFVIEPGAEIELNVFKFFRFSLGAYYRYTSNLDLYDTSKDALRGFSYAATFKFGVF
jgi:hypothetical protein